MGDEPVRLGLIGVGAHAGQVLIPAIQRCPDLRLVVLATAGAESATLAQARFAVPAVVGHERVLERADVDAVIIATPPPTHAALTVAALSAGKHVFCETPGVRTPDEVQAVARALAATGRVLSYGTCLRYAPIYEQLGRLLADFRTEAGVVLTARYYAGLRHIYDLALGLLGDVSRVTSLRGGDQTVVALEFASGDLGIVHGGGPTNFGVPLELVEVSGPAGLLSARGSRELWSFTAPGAADAFSLALDSAPATVWSAPTSIPYGALNQLTLRGYVPELAAFAAAIRSRGQTKSGLIEAERTLRVERAVARSAAERRPVDVAPRLLQV